MSFTTKIHSYDGVGKFNVYVAEPEGRPRGAVLVIQEIFGVDTDIRWRCDLLAQSGYLAIAPDLFWRLDPGMELDPDVKSNMKRSVDVVIRFNTDKGVHDVQSTINKAREIVGSKLKVGLVGYCLGGRMAAYASARTDIDAAVSYYGVQIERMLDEKDAIRNPLMLHMPEFDEHVGKEIQTQIHAAFESNPQISIYDYPGEHHGFACTLGKRRSEAAAAFADQRTADFLSEHIG
ncbi:dienelactone hydrolase family protein [Dyadobacter sp. CY356]|uniref:dienelactone hydrolase family protein n=1 Tax=Dyadobacter sp. CY356 TaxID=2906442 RepID=UPI001F1AB049|nr:dienelactone hydrolase family protein [Dyadobacter sp. CY356]MCF0055327.1 dienelactone hydrolase family protein [Dyadobacter sp. CY356]